MRSLAWLLVVCPVDTQECCAGLADKARLIDPSPLAMNELQDIDFISEVHNQDNSNTIGCLSEDKK